nr:MAG TPA: hypothetical protein [Caudoviricetes sp.]
MPLRCDEATALRRLGTTPLYRHQHHPSHFPPHNATIALSAVSLFTITPVALSRSLAAKRLRN